MLPLHRLGEHDRMVEQVDLKFSITLVQRSLVNQLPVFLSKTQVLVKQNHDVDNQQQPLPDRTPTRKATTHHFLARFEDQLLL